MNIPKSVLYCFLAGSSALCAGCATEIRPWERGYLAEEHMAVEPDPLERTIREQIVTSKEGSEGGHGVVGGGCGCN